MDFTLSTLSSSLSNTLVVHCHLPLITLSSKRRQLAPPSRETLPRHPCNDLKYESTNSHSSTSSSSCSSLTFKLDSKTNSNDNDDDETASTVSTSTSTDVSLDDECCPDFADEPTTGCITRPRKSVSFVFPVVTHVYTRQSTTTEDKYYLHYSDADFLDFKIGFITGKDRTRKVNFARDVVSEVASIPAVPQHMKDVFYYSESELQVYVGFRCWVCVRGNLCCVATYVCSLVVEYFFRSHALPFSYSFLDEFVHSLNQRV